MCIYTSVQISCITCLVSTVYGGSKEGVIYTKKNNLDLIYATLLWYKLGFMSFDWCPIEVYQHHLLFWETWWIQLHFSAKTREIKNGKLIAWNPLYSILESSNVSTGFIFYFVHVLGFAYFYDLIMFKWYEYSEQYFMCSFYF